MVCVRMCPFSYFTGLVRLCKVVTLFFPFIKNKFIQIFSIACTELTWCTRVFFFFYCLLNLQLSGWRWKGSRSRHHNPKVSPKVSSLDYTYAFEISLTLMTSPYHKVKHHKTHTPPIIVIKKESWKSIPLKFYNSDWLSI